MSSRKISVDTNVMDPLQLNRIESVHRGFLYQHLYAVACLLKLGATEEGTVSIERDEDVEVNTADNIICIQVKTRSNPIIKSDINGALDRFNELRIHFSKIFPQKKLSFVIATNKSLGPGLTKIYSEKSWPKDVLIVSPGNVNTGGELLPPTWNDLNEAVQWCIDLAERIPFTNLQPDTLVWKLAARVQFAATGEDRERQDHVFKRADLPALFELLVEQLQEFPAIPLDFKPQKNEPSLLSKNTVRMIVGFSGAGKTVWSSWQARHCSAFSVYFDVGDLLGNAIAGSLARELAARFLSNGMISSAQLPSSSGLDILRVLDKRLALTEKPLVVIDNIHRIHTDDIKNIINACPKLRFILMAQPLGNIKELEAKLNIKAEELYGWDEDTIASVFASAGASISTQSASKWLSITGGMPLFVKNAASLCVKLADGDSSAFADQVEQGEHPEELAQESLLRMTIESLSDCEASVVIAFSLSSVLLSIAEVRNYLETLPENISSPGAVLRSLQRKGILQVFANGFSKIHDAMKVPTRDLYSRLSKADILNLQVRLRDILYSSLIDSQDLVRLGAWMRLLPPTGQVEVLVDIATTEFFHEMGEPQELKEILISVANANDTEPSLRFWTLDALLFWEYQRSVVKQISDKYLEKMTKLVATGKLGDREYTALKMKKLAFAGTKKDNISVDEEFKKLENVCKNDPELARIIRYSYAAATYQCGDYTKALSLAEALGLEYYDVLQLDPIDIFGASTQKIIDQLSRSFGECQDDLKHLADCLDLMAKCKRSIGQMTGFTAIHAAKLSTQS